MTAPSADGPRTRQPRPKAPARRDGPPIDRKARLRIPPHHVTKQPPFERVHNWDEVYYGYTPEPAMFEAQRCIQCPAEPCVAACPIGNDIPGALAQLELGRIAPAAAPPASHAGQFARVGVSGRDEQDLDYWRRAVRKERLRQVSGRARGRRADIHRDGRANRRGNAGADRPPPT